MSNTNAATKAWATRRARAEFAETYGDECKAVMQMIEQNYNDTAIMEATDISKRTLAAYKSHHTRGTYSTSLPACNF